MNQVMMCGNCAKLYVTYSSGLLLCTSCQKPLVAWDPADTSECTCPVHPDTPLVRIGTNLICAYCNPPEELDQMITETCQVCGKTWTKHTEEDVCQCQRDICPVCGEKLVTIPFEDGAKGFTFCPHCQDLSRAETQVPILAPEVQELFSRAMVIFADRAKRYGTDNIRDTGISGVLARMRDKLARADQLTGAESPDSMVDTALDLANYAIILASLAADTWPKHKDALQILESTSEHIRAPAINGDVGYDLSASKNIHCLRGLTYVPTGVKFKMPPGVWCTIIGRSSLLFKKHAFVPSCVIDNGYTGEITVPVMNPGHTIYVKEGERIAQIIFHRVLTPRMVSVPVLPKTERGPNGFGSTGQ